MAEAVWPTEAFSQPLPLQALAEAVMALPISSLGPVPPPRGLSPHASVGQAADVWDPHFQERARIIARIAGEELPRILPLAAPMFRAATAELYARTFTVAELDEVTRFYATPAGRALARESIAAVVDPEFVRGSLLLTPRAAAEAAGAMVRIGQSTVGLPPPPPAPLRASLPPPAPPAPPRP
jgi:hypothetical protein